MRRIFLLVVLAIGLSRSYAQTSVEEAFQCILDPDNQKVCLISWSPNGRWIATTTNVRIEVDIWDAETHTLFRTIPTDADALTWNRQGDQLATVTGNEINVWDVESSIRVVMIEFTDIVRAEFDAGTRTAMPDRFTSIDWNDDTSQIAIVSLNWIAVWHLSPPDFVVRNDPPERLHEGSPFAAMWNPASGELFVAHSQGRFEIYNSETLELENVIDSGGYGLNVSNRLQVFSFSPDGRSLVTDGIGYNDGGNIVVRILDVSTGEITFIPGQVEKINAVAWSPDGEFIATGTGILGGRSYISRDNSVRIWDAESYELLKEIYLHTPVTSLSWNPDSTQLAAANLEGAVYIIDVQE